MRILASADLHGLLDTYRWLIETTKTLEPDAVVLAGDLLGAGQSFDTVQREQLEEARLLETSLEDLSCPILYIMGNDDWIGPPFEGRQFSSLHGKRIELGEFNFVGYQYSLPFMSGIWEKPEAGIQEDLANIEPLLDSRTVFVTHQPPEGILDGGHGGIRVISA